MKLSNPTVCAVALAWMCALASYAGEISKTADAGDSSKAGDLTKCDSYYEDRANPESVRLAYTCYVDAAGVALTSGNAALRKVALSKAMQTSVWIVQLARPEEGAPEQPGWRETRRDYISRALPLTETLVKEFPTSGASYYWRAIFVSFDCGELGFGTKAIKCIFGRLDQVDADLKKALEISADVHGAGPERTMGYSAMFQARMGRSTIAEALGFATAALKRAPRCTLNSMLVAKLLNLDSESSKNTPEEAAAKKEAARKLYQKVLDVDPRNPTQVDPEFIQEAYLDQTKARAALEKL